MLGMICVDLDQNMYMLFEVDNFYLHSFRLYRTIMAVWRHLSRYGSIIEG
jgi:hypothetical protein